MYEKLSVLLMEDEEGKTSVQLFASPESADESFKQLHGKPGDQPSRATMVHIDYTTGKFEGKTKGLPTPRPDENDIPDAFVLGEGPVVFEKETGKDE